MFAFAHLLRTGHAALGLVCALPGLLQAAPPAGAGGSSTSSEVTRIYSCVDNTGRRISSDRPIPECANKEQRVLNRDASVRTVVPPVRTAEEVQREEAIKRQKAQEQSAREEVVRRDRTLLTRFPDPRTHELARQRALEPVSKLIETARSRLAALEAEADALTTARAGLGFKPVPEELKERTIINEGAVEAQRNILRNQEAERDRINLQFDTERQRLQQLWDGAPLGFVDNNSSSKEPATSPTRSGASSDAR